jgi:hypothetical protein
VKRTRDEINAARLLRTRARAEFDVEDLGSKLGTTFTSNDIGHALWGRGREWSEFCGVLTRWQRFSFIESAGSETFGRGQRLRRRWRFTDRGDA